MHASLCNCMQAYKLHASFCNCMHSFVTACLYRLVQCCTDLYNVVQTCKCKTVMFVTACLYRLVQFCTCLYNVVHACTMLYMLVQCCTDLYNVLQTCTMLYRLVQCSTDLLVYSKGMHTDRISTWGTDRHTHTHRRH